MTAATTYIFRPCSIAAGPRKFATRRSVVCGDGYSFGHGYNFRVRGGGSWMLWKTRRSMSSGTRTGYDITAGSDAKRWGFIGLGRMG